MFAELIVENVVMLSLLCTCVKTCFFHVSLWLYMYIDFLCVGIDEDDVAVGGEAGEASTEDMPPLEGEEEDDASRMEEVD